MTANLAASDNVLDAARQNKLPLLQTDKLVKIYGGRSVVNGVDINVNQGEIVGLLGPNGAGKTTTFYMIVGLVRPNGGRVFFNNVDVTNEPMYRRARLGMGYLPQEESIFRKLTVEENILAILQTTKVPKKEHKQRCEELLNRFGIEHVAKQYALTLSGGEKRRLSIARSLVTNPTMIMLDEPFSGVDPIAVEDLQKEVVRLKHEFGKSVLITDHNVAQTLRVCDRALIINDGRVFKEGSPREIINDPAVRATYLGNTFRGDEFDNNPFRTEADLRPL